MSDFNMVMLPITYVSIAIIMGFLVWLECFHKSHLVRATEYATECMNKGMSPPDTRALVAHWLEWDVKVHAGQILIGEGSSYDNILANNIAREAVQVAFFGERTRESTKPRVRIPAEVE